MKLNKFFLIGAIALGMVACKSEDVPTPDNGKGDTYVGLTVKFPVASTARALSDDYNKKGEWQGRDKVEALTVYVVTGTTSVVTTQFPLTAFHGITADGELNPKLAVEAQAGDQVKAYVVINDVNNKVTSLLSSATAADFDIKFAEAVASVVAVADVATTKEEGSETKDIVVMTNQVAPTAITVLPNVKKEEAISGAKNQMKVNVSRVASRGILTIKEDYTKAVEVKDNTGATKSTITIKDVQYQVTGSALKFNVLEDRTTWQVPSDVYGYIPAGNNHTWGPTTPSPAGIMLFTDAGNWQNVIAKTDGTDEKIIEALKAETYSKFTLPVTHADGNYKKGNTTMFEIKATFTVDKIDGVDPTGTEPVTVYLGMKDGLFYSTQAKAEEMNAAFDGTTAVNHKQDAREYTAGTMYYYIWLNPDQAYGQSENKIKKSPTVRNQVYHAFITGFKEIGVSKKDDIDPDEPLQSDKTYISVQLKVLPWTIHSYSVDLGNEY